MSQLHTGERLAQRHRSIRDNQTDLVVPGEVAIRRCFVKDEKPFRPRQEVGERRDEGSSRNSITIGVREPPFARRVGASKHAQKGLPREPLQAIPERSTGPWRGPIRCLAA